jgi:hypothetical protein
MDTANVTQCPSAVNSDMADHINVDDRRRRVCLRKCRFRIITKALQALNRATSRGEKNLGVYRCPYCSLWHLGHVPRERRP